MSPAAAYEWRYFLRQVAHLYRRDQLAADYPLRLLPWCEEHRPFGLRHERYGISASRVAAPAPEWTCSQCTNLLNGNRKEINTHDRSP